MEAERLGAEYRKSVDKLMLVCVPSHQWMECLGAILEQLIGPTIDNEHCECCNRIPQRCGFPQSF